MDLSNILILQFCIQRTLNSRRQHVCLIPVGRCAISINQSVFAIMQVLDDLKKMLCLILQRKSLQAKWMELKQKKTSVRRKKSNLKLCFIFFWTHFCTPCISWVFIFLCFLILCIFISRRRKTILEQKNLGDSAVRCLSDSFYLQE